jgi:FkbM family methyltransferase
VIVDVGCADDADFSIHLIHRFGVTCYGVDPTRKHAAALRDLQERHRGRFHYLPRAVAATSGILRFSESETNVSGSLLDDHSNVRRDPTNFYDVQAITLPELVRTIGVASVDLLKLDIEGAEYELIQRLGKGDLDPFQQMFIEFHDQVVDRYSVADTRQAIKTICSHGFRAFSLDDRNFLFYRVTA